MESVVYSHYGELINDFIVVKGMYGFDFQR